MSIEGRIAIDVGFTDTHTKSAVQSVQRISLTSTDAYTAGQVAVISGVCGTAVESVSFNPTSYRDASGSLVSFSNVSRIAFQSSRACNYSDSANDLVAQTFCVFSPSGSLDISIRADGTSGTASFTLVLYGT
jgi:hypothetical protein